MLTLFQPRGTDHAHHITASTPGFENLKTPLPYTTSLSQPRWNEGKSTSGLYSVVSWPAYLLELLIVTPSASPSSCCPAISSIARGASGAIHWCHLGVLNFQPSWDRVHLPNRTRVFLFQSFRIWLRSGVHFPNRTRVFIL